ncbi:non-homologous end-joining DNA ligase [Mangrovivirga cuniculi]|uniref:DNA ligase (ATP) n=1 Tax=Mangrovivirga cuniculi TaxID=2715131 RepID=A0A4D7K7D8_9BACT|nr:non-homologous end-joining DNA ligase [Mangrovivirga cuniculi]QCK16624.1 ATP-dependent DNA ligase [Mangrovivirga cuniculi]
MDLSEEQKEKVKKKEQPVWMEPSLAKLTDDYFSDPDWIYERKLDGVRCLVFKNGKEVKLLSRNKKSQNEIYPEIVKAVKKINSDFIADGEIVTFKNDISSFSELQARINNRNPSKELINKVPVFYYLFDLMYIDDTDITELDLRTRKKILSKEIPFSDPIRYCSHINENGEKYLEKACNKGWEGIIAKNATKPYLHSRTSNWLKFKCDKRQEFVIGGYTDPEGERVGFGALLIGFYENGKLKYAGKVGTGYSDKQLEEMENKMSKKQRKTSPFDEEIKDNGIHFITPEMVAEIGFTEWTNDNKLRHPRFIGLRKDKDPKNVKKETPA